MTSTPAPPWLRAGGAAVLALLVCAAGWVIAHRLPLHGRAPALWSEQDLPPLPDGRGNGWVIADAAAAWLDRDVVPLGLREPLAEPEWNRLRSLATPIRQLRSDPVLREWETLAETAFGAPRFADACAISVEARCHSAALVRLRDVAALAAVGAALEGRWEEAFARAARLLRADADLMGTSRSALTALVARLGVRRDLALIGVLLDGVAREAPARQDPLRPLLQGIASQLEPAAVLDTDCRRAVITEYLFVTVAVRQVSRAAGSKRGGLPRLLLDEEHAVGLANRYFERLESYARNPSAVEAPALPRHTRATRLWWVWDAAGKMILDASMLDLAPALRDMAVQAAAIDATREALRQRIGALLAAQGGRQRRAAPSP